MICPRCLSEKTTVTKTIKNVNVVERYRQCPDCKYTFLTTEAIKNDRYWEEYAEYTFSTNQKEDKRQGKFSFEQ